MGCYPQCRLAQSTSKTLVVNQAVTTDPLLISAQMLSPIRAAIVFRPASPLPPVTPWLNMAVPVSPMTVIANGVVPPIRMASFPAMETLQPERFTEQPDIARSQIVILVAHETDVFVTIPGVTVRNHGRGGIDGGGRCGIDHWLRSHHHEGPNPCHPSIWLNDTTGQQPQSSGRDGQGK